MKVFNSNGLCILVRDIEQLICKCSELRRSGSVQPPDALMDTINLVLTDGLELCKSTELEAARAKISLILTHMEFHKEDVDTSTLFADLRNAHDMLMTDMWKRKFIQIDADYSDYVNNETLFGDAVHKAFPSARPDIREAGNCIATDCGTAAIFHLMRVAEYGLRALAHDRRIVIPKKRPIELATWDSIIKELETAEQAIQQYPQTLAREKQFEFYHGANMEVKRFKNVFRNRVMHTREDYDQKQALSAHKHVGDFMTILASKISETRRTPMIWK
jgi:hypothetical protein